MVLPGLYLFAIRKITMMSKFISGTAAAILLAGAPALRAGDTFNFQDASGVCQGSAEKMAAPFQDALGWDRQEYGGWGSCEPKRGVFNDQPIHDFGKAVIEYRKQGKQVLPILDYGVDWACDKTGTFIAGDKKSVYHPGPNGKVLVDLYKREGDGRWTKTAGNADTHPSFTPIAQEFVPDWENHVRRVVKILRAPPYNVEYFQIWNEAHPESGFWQGDLDTYMTRIHLPAAKVIHELGGKVVYGGWPCCGSLHEYVALLDKHRAWSSIDVLDVHYFPVSAFYVLRQESRKRGFNLAIWQTEVAFTTDINYVGNTYPRFVDWCLRNQPARDKYKLFFFAMGSPDDPKAYGYGRTFLSGERPSGHGKSIIALGKLLKGANVKLYEPVTSMPRLKPELDERLSAMEAFLVDEKRIVVAIHMIPSNSAKIYLDADGNSIHLDMGTPTVALAFPELKKDRIAKVERWSMTGSVTDLTAAVAAAPAGAGVTLAAPIRDADLKDGNYIDMPEGQVRQTFYVAITLK